MAKQKTIIIVDDNKGVLSALKLLLKNHFENIIALPSPVTLLSAIRQENPDVVLLDMNFTDALNSGNEGLYWLHEIKKIHPALPVVLFTAYADALSSRPPSMLLHWSLPPNCMLQPYFWYR